MRMSNKSEFHSFDYTPKHDYEAMGYDASYFADLDDELLDIDHEGMGHSLLLYKDISSLYASGCRLDGIFNCKDHRNEFKGLSLNSISASESKRKLKNG